MQHLYLCLLFHSSVVYLYLLCFPCLGGILLVLFFKDRTCWHYWPVLLCAYGSLHSAFLSVTSSPFLENILCFSFSCSSNCKLSSLISSLLSKYKHSRRPAHQVLMSGVITLSQLKTFFNSLYESLFDSPPVIRNVFFFLNVQACGFVFCFVLF